MARPWLVMILGFTSALTLSNHAQSAGQIDPPESARDSLADTVQTLTANGWREAEQQRRVAQRFQNDHPAEWDWLLQDGGRSLALGDFTPRSVRSIVDCVNRVLDDLGDEAGDLRDELVRLETRDIPHGDACWWQLYLDACERRRSHRLTALLESTPTLVFVKRKTIRPSFFAYTEGQSDAQHERHFLPGSELCLLDLRNGGGKVESLIHDPTGVIRDPAVSWDAKRVIFAWKKDLDHDDYHLYELELSTRRIRQLTEGIGFADYEPAFLPNGDLIFSSTRCVQTVDCWWTEVSNLYTCDPDGRYLRRLGFDQVHSVHPAVLNDGRVVYTRWDYNDRGQIFPQPLFQMNPDGSGQTEFYGNNSWFPTTLAHARSIPGTSKVLAVFCGHHTAQAGKLGIIDPMQGRQENEGARLIAPLRSTPAERIDAYGQLGELFRYPHPLNESEFLVTYAPLGWDYREGHFGIYWMNLKGERELLAFDPTVPCGQSVPLVRRTPPPVLPSQVDYSQHHGTYYLQNVYEGPGLRGIAPGTIKRLRVVALDFRAAGVGNNYSEGPGGGALISTPIAVGNGSWDVKVVLGDATVHADGSAFFQVPARTPVYFQALDAKGHAIQTMRSWSTLQPGENASCVGCHESKNSAPPNARYGTTLAIASGPEPLTPFYGPPRGFSFTREIQPILDRHCVRCHNDRTQTPPRDVSRQPIPMTRARDVRVFSLLGETTVDPQAKRQWSDAYLALTGARRQDMPWARDVYAGDPQGNLVNWIGSQSVPTLLPPASAGATRSRLLTLLEQGHQDVQLTREEMEKIACWIDLLIPYCGDYREANAWSPDEQAKYERFLEKRRRMEAQERENIAAWQIRGKQGRTQNMEH